MNINALYYTDNRFFFVAKNSLNCDVTHEIHTNIIRDRQEAFNFACISNEGFYICGKYVHFPCARVVYNGAAPGFEVKLTLELGRPEHTHTLSWTFTRAKDESAWLFLFAEPETLALRSLEHTTLVYSDAYKAQLARARQPAKKPARTPLEQCVDMLLTQFEDLSEQFGEPGANNADILALQGKLMEMMFRYGKK